MSTHKHIDIICICAISFAVALTLLLMNGRAFGIMPVVNAEDDNPFFTTNDLDGDWDTSAATKIELSDKGSKISGNGAYVHEGDIYLAYAGHYVFTGELTDGSIIIDADKNDKIWISLNGAVLHCEDGAAIRVEQADKVFLTLADGTENSISSGARYDEELIAAGVDGAIYSRDDLTINGTGSLVVNAAYCHGIVCNDDLVITGGDIVVNAQQDGIHANDSVRIRNAAIFISAGDDGITVSNDDETAFLYVESGSIAIPACYEGMEATDITIAGGNIDIRATDDGINANGSGSAVIRITGGDITITNPSGRDADGLDSNGSIYIEGGKIFISVTDSGGNNAVDYGSENGGECVISGGTVIACGSSAMAEGFSTDSSQGFLMYNTTAAAGTMVSLTDSSGRELFSGEIPCSFSSVVISVPGMKLGDVCTITVGDVQEEVTIDNMPAFGAWPMGMFGGGMHSGRGREEMTEGRESDDGSAAAAQKGKGPQGDMPQDDGIWGGADFGDRQGMEPPGGLEDGSAGPPGLDALEPPDSGAMEPPDSGTMEFPDRPDISGSEGWPDRQEIQEAGGRPFTPDTGALQGNETGFQQRDWGQKGFGGDNLSSGISADTLALVGISVLVLLIGLVVAIKVKH